MAKVSTHTLPLWVCDVGSDVGVKGFLREHIRDFRSFPRDIAEDCVECIGDFWSFTYCKFLKLSSRYHEGYVCLKKLIRDFRSFI